MKRIPYVCGTIGFAPIVFAAVGVLRAQQPADPKLSAPYAEAALQALHAIQADSAVYPQITGDVERKIKATESESIRSEEHSVSSMLRQIWELKGQDNTLLRGYGKVAEIESYQDNSKIGSEEEDKQKKRDYAISQLADSEAAIRNREQACFDQLRKFLSHGGNNITRCLEWINRTKLPSVRQR